MSVRRGITIHDAPCRDIHRGLMRALFLTLSHGKFAHGIFRSAALLKQATKKRLPSILKLGGD